MVIYFNFANQSICMSEEMEWQPEHELTALIKRFEGQEKSGKGHFFDVEEFEAIIDYYLDNHERTMARQAIEGAKQQHPQSSSFGIREARLLAAESQYEQALEVLERLEVLEPGDEEIFFTKGEIFGMMDRHSNAIQEYKKLLDTDTERMIDVLTNIAYEYESMNDFDQALVYLEKALYMESDSDDLIQEIAFFFEINHKEDEAIAFYTRFLDEHPYSTYGWFHLGIFYSTQELYEKAIQAYEFVLAIDEKFAAAYFNMANSYSSLKLFRKAINLYKETFNFEPPEAITYCYIGECYENLDAIDKALKYYYMALEKDERLPESWAGVARVFMKQDRNKMAVKYYQKAVELAPHQDDIKFELAVLYLQLNEYDKSATLFEEVVKNNKNYVEAWMNYSLVYALQGDFDTAQDIMSSAIASNDGDALLRFRQAGYFYRSGKLEQAYVHMEKAFKLDFEAHTDLLDYIPELMEDSRFLEMLDLYKEPKK